MTKRRVMVLSVASFGIFYACTAALQPSLRHVHPPELMIMRGIIADSLLESPQFHDFQRLMFGRPGQNATMEAAAVLSPPEFMDVQTPANVWRNVAVLIVGAGQTLPGFGAGTHCYYLRNAGAYPARSWEARRWHRGDRRKCPSGLPNGTQSLEVVDTTAGPTPLAVRLHIGDFVQGNHNVVIGVPCHDRWCLLQRPGEKLLPGMGQGEKNRVPGWHDEQFLAYRRNARTFASAVRARLAPVDSLDTMSFDTVFKDVAEINLTGFDPAALPHYQAKWNLPTYNWQSPVKVSMRRWTDGTWWARFTASGMTSTTPIPVEHNEVPMFMSPRSQGMLLQLESTARWGYESEGGFWVRCASGCCTVS